TSVPNALPAEDPTSAAVDAESAQLGALEPTIVIATSSMTVRRMGVPSFQFRRFHDTPERGEARLGGGGGDDHFLLGLPDGAVRACQLLEPPRPPQSTNRTWTRYDAAGMTAVVK